MARNIKKNMKTPLNASVDLVGVTKDDVIREYIKKYDVPPQGSAAVVLADTNTISRIAVNVGIYAGLSWAKEHPETVVITSPPSPPPAGAPINAEERTTRYVG